MHRDPAAYEIGDDVGLQIGERENEVGFERDNLADVGGCESGDTRLLSPHARGAHGVAGYAHNPYLLTEELQCLHRFFRETRSDAAEDLMGALYPDWRGRGISRPVPLA